MSNRFLELKDGVIVEIGSPGEAREEMHAATADHIDTSMEMVGSMIEKIVRPLGNAFGGLRAALDTPIAIDSAEVELGVSFSAEGNLFVAKTTGEGSLTIKVAFKALS